MKRMMMGVLLGLAASSAPAADVYRCVDAGGQVALRDTPCPSGTRTASVRNVTTDEGHSGEAYQRARDDAEWRMAANRRLAQSAGTNRTHHGRRPQRRTPRVSAECEQAKRERTRREANANIDLRRRLNDAVFAACKGF